MANIKTKAAKDNILNRIKVAKQTYQAPKPYPELGKLDTAALYPAATEADLAPIFADAFQKTGGKFIYCADAKELVSQLSTLASLHNWNQVACAHKNLFTYLINNKVNFVRDLDPHNDSYDACITDCEVAIARTGSFIFSSLQNYGRTAAIYYPVHIIVLQPHQVVYEIQDGLKIMKQKYQQNLPSMINLATGPSRTADIEKTLVTGVHGPKEIYCFWLEN